jgi:hypothetical protein
MNKKIKPMENTTHALLKNEFDLPNDEEAIDEVELLEILAQRILSMLEHEPEQLMSMLYRLDVEERKIIPVMHPSASFPVHYGLANLVLERQKQRIETKNNIKTLPLSDDLADWAW